MLKPGNSVPEISIPDQNGTISSLSSFRGKYLLLYFYPKDFTPGCTKEACDFRDAFPRFNPDKITVVGVSTDTIASHKKFADKNSLPFTLLADTDKKLVEAFGVWQPKKFMGKEFLGTVRTSFLINPEGKIVKVYEKVNPLIHAAEVEKDLQALSKMFKEQPVC